MARLPDIAGKGLANPTALLDEWYQWRFVISA
jgi:hypothetical protein